MEQQARMETARLGRTSGELPSCYLFLFFFLFIYISPRLTFLSPLSFEPLLTRTPDGCEHLGRVHDHHPAEGLSDIG